MLSEIRHTEKNLYEESKIGKLIEAENRRVVDRGFGE